VSEARIGGSFSVRRESGAERVAHSAGRHSYQRRTQRATPKTEARLDKKLLPNQEAIATQAEIITRACAKLGIIALIDEATGYQAFRKKQELQLKLQAFIAEDLQEWALMFPHEFWFELARLEGVHYSPRSRPLRWGKYIMAFVYDAVDGDVGK
jgi:hypothetical protein